MNQSLLNLLHAFAQKSSDWEDHLQLLMFEFRTSKYSSTHMKLSLVIIHHLYTLQNCTPLQSYVDPQEYSIELHQKLLEIRELVDANIVHSTTTLLSWEGTLKEGQKGLVDNATKGGTTGCASMQ